MSVNLGISKILLSQLGRPFIQQKSGFNTLFRLLDGTQNAFKISQFNGFKFFQQMNSNIQTDSLSSIIMKNFNLQSVSSSLEGPKRLEIDEAILNVNTHQRKRAKVKREKLKQRRKKIRRLSERKREKYNY
ncbi:hypothetical protein ABPG72_006955 [Tetrahymena utriculariae]